MDYQVPPASVFAYRPLLELNTQVRTPEMTEWLHSQEAEPLLAQILIDVPCSVTLH